MTFVVVSPRVELTHEDLDLDHIYGRYFAGEIEAEEMEADIDLALHGEYDRPMGGMAYRPLPLEDLTG